MRVKIKDVAKQIRGVSYKPTDVVDTLSDDSIVLLRSNNINDGSINLSDVVYVNKQKIKEAQLLKKGDILICASSGSKNLVGKSAYIDKNLQMAFGAFCKVVRPISGNARYLGYFFESPFYRCRISNASAGANINNIRTEDINNLEVEWPNLETQNQIAIIFDKVTTLIALRKQQLDKIDELVKSRFVELFENDNNNWPITHIGDIASVSVGVVIKPAQFYTTKDEGVPAFRSLNVGELCIKDKEWVYFNREGNLLNSKSIVQAGDVLVIRSGAPGLACVVTPEFAGYNVIDLIIAHPDKAIINSIFLAAFTNFGSGRNQISRMIGGAAQKHINVGRYKSLILKLPPKNLQDQFANFIQQLDKSKLAVQKSLVNWKFLRNLSCSSTSADENPRPAMAFMAGCEFFCYA